MKKILALLTLFAIVAGFLPGNVAAQKKPRYYRNYKSGKYTKNHNRRLSPKARVTENTLLAKNSVSSANGNNQPMTQVEAAAANAPSQPTVSVSSSARTEDIQNGSVVVKVTSNGNASVKIGMSPMGVTMIEFPANDPIYEIHRNDLYSDFVTVSCRQQDGSGRCLDNPTDAIVLRPGKNFRFTGDGSESTVITVQRVSGIVVSFIIVPVASIAQNVNHVVVTYPVSDIVQARMKAGLIVNLAPFINASPQTTPPDTKIAASNNPDGTAIINASFNTAGTNTAGTATVPNEENKTDDLESQTVAELTRVGNSGFAMRFTKPVHGLEIAVAPNNLRLTGRVIDTFAIRNTLTVPIKLVSDMPELYIETMAKKKESINSVRVAVLYRATTIDDSDILQPGETHYVSVAYEVPILGAKQTLKVAFAQTNAADEPVVLELTGIAR